MLIHNQLPITYDESINYVYEHYKNENVTGEKSIHYWIDDVNNKELMKHLNCLRNATEIKKQIALNYPNHNVLSVHSSDEIYLSVSPSHRQGSDITLSDCHYDAPFKYIYQEGNVFLRLILSVNENKTVYTQVEDATSLLSTGDYNIIDYNQDYHCVHGKIPKNKDRVLLKLHYIAQPKYSTDISTEFCKYINN